MSLSIDAAISGMVEQQRNIELIRYRRFGPELLMLDLVAATSTKGVFIDTKASPVDGGAAGGGNKYKTIGIVLQELDPGMLDRFEALRAYMMALGDDVQETRLRFYIAFKRIKNFACVEFRPTQGKILIFVKVDPSTVQLKPGFTRDVSNLGHFGCGEQTIHLVIGAWQRRVRISRDDPLAAHHAHDPLAAHQSFDCAAGGVFALPPQNMPYLLRTIELAVGIPGRADLDAEGGVRFGPGRSQVRIPCDGPPVIIGGRGELQCPTDRLDPE